MDFGFVDAADIHGIDFTLPEDGFQTRQLLGNKAGAIVPVFHVGCSSWGRDSWSNLIYPRNTQPKDKASLYVEKFNSIEFSGFYLNTPRQDMNRRLVATFKNRGCGDFVIYPKIPR